VREAIFPCGSAPGSRRRSYSDQGLNRPETRRLGALFSQHLHPYFWTIHDPDYIVSKSCIRSRNRYAAPIQGAILTTSRIATIALFLGALGFAALYAQGYLLQASKVGFIAGRLFSAAAIAGLILHFTLRKRPAWRDSCHVWYMLHHCSIASAAVGRMGVSCRSQKKFRSPGRM
jgi:hypothetical protein